MSIRFPSDDNTGMSGSGGPRKRGGGGFFFLLIFGVIAFMVMRGLNSSGSGTADPGQTNPAERGGVTQYPDLQQPSTQRADQSDWGMDTDVAVQKNPVAEKPSSKSRNGFEMEDVVTTPKEQPAGRFSQPATTNGSATTKKPATQGDWGLDTDVDSTPKSTVPKKTIKGDWGLEQVD